MNKELRVEDDNFMSNMAEEEFGQLHAIHNNMNAIANVRRQLEKQAAQPSLEECEECGDEIPLARRKAIPGVRLCVFCKEKQERH
jgi:phage/conjugal plasmid C-4 type zinc finger TraR family protein